MDANLQTGLICGVGIVLTYAHESSSRGGGPLRSLRSVVPLFYVLCLTKGLSPLSLT